MKTGQTNTMLWYDYETFGADTRRDRISQFAAIRTDFDLNQIEEPINLFCQPAKDHVPDPFACLVTGITPQRAQHSGLLEAEFCQQVFTHMAVPNTCTLGYNSIRFDDEMTRSLFYRNLRDPYQREWKNGNSRWDLLDVVRMTYALRPDGMQWPKGENGQVSFRLELLTHANGIQHATAHDAVSDVLATIEFARLIKSKQPKLFEYALNLRNKNYVKNQIDLFNRKPVLNFSGMFSVEQGCMALLAPVAIHPTNRNEIICFDLSQNPERLEQLSIEEIKYLLFTPGSELAEHEQRIGIKSIHLNRSPMIAPASMLTPEVVSRWNLNLPQLKKHAQLIKQMQGLEQKLNLVFQKAEAGPVSDPDVALYDGFIGDADRSRLNQALSLSPEQLAHWEMSFDDVRIPALLFRYRARNWPDYLTPKELLHWQDFCRQRVEEGKYESPRTVRQAQADIEKLLLERKAPRSIEILNQLSQYLKTFNYS